MPSKAVFCEVGADSLEHRVFVMYHATAPQNVGPILRDGFDVDLCKPTTMLGKGIYVTTNPRKCIASKYGGVTLKLLVYVGKVSASSYAFLTQFLRLFFSPQVKKIQQINDPSSKTWQTHFDTAWVPAGIDRVSIPSGMSESCVRSAKQVKVLGVTRGWERLGRDVQALTRRVQEDPDCTEEEDREMLKELVMAQVGGLGLCQKAMIA